jgi:hypothetical protein
MAGPPRGGGVPSRYASAPWASTGLTSMTGVPSMASIGPIRNRIPQISRTVTRCSPNGFGRCGLHGELITIWL